MAGDESTWEGENTKEQTRKERCNLLGAGNRQIAPGKGRLRHDTAGRKGERKVGKR